MRARNVRRACRTQDQHAAPVVGRLRRRRHRQARRHVHRSRRKVGADFDRRPYRQYAGQTARRRGRRRRASRRPAQGAGDRGMERNRHDRQSRRPRQQGRLGQGRCARTAAGDEADRRLGRGADEHPPHQLDLGFVEGHGEGRHHIVAEDLGRIQRRLRQGRRREAHLPRPFQRGLDGCDDLRGRPLRNGPRPLQEGLRRRRHDGDALSRDGQGARAIPPYGLEVHGSGDRRPRLQSRRPT